MRVDNLTDISKLDLQRERRFPPENDRFCQKATHYNSQPEKHIDMTGLQKQHLDFSTSTCTV